MQPDVVGDTADPERTIGRQTFFPIGDFLA
jgi:hypothetical protein